MGAECSATSRPRVKCDHGLLEGEQAQRPLPRRHAVVEGFVGVGQGSAHGVMEGQLIHVASRASAWARSGARDLVVIPHTAPAEELAVDGVADQGVAERIAIRILPDAPEQAGLLRTVEGVEPGRV